MKIGYGLVAAVAMISTGAYANTIVDTNSNNTKASEAIPSQINTPAADTVTTSSAAPGVSEAQIETKAPFSMAYINIINSPTFEEGEGVVFNHILAPKFKFSPAGWAIGANIYFDSRVGTVEDGQSSATAFDMGDIAMKFYTPSLGNVGFLKITPQIRYYVPVDGSLAGTGGLVQPRLYATGTAGKFEFLGILIPTFFVSSADSADLALNLYWKNSYRTSKSATVDLALYPKTTLKGGKYELNKIVTDVGMTLTPADNVSIIPYVEFNMMDPSLKTTNLITEVEWAFL